MVSSTAGAADDPAGTPVAPVEAIVITAEKLPVQTLIDRKVYTVTSDVQSTFGALSDILNVIPSVDVDPAGVVSLRGDSNVLILVDGKPSTLFSGGSAGDHLQSIPARNIERVEILTTPPAEFRAEGAAGVINIITRKKQPEGMAGSVQGSLGSGNRAVIGADASYSAKKLTAAVSAGYRQDYKQRLTQSEVIVNGSGTGPPLASESSSRERIRREAPTAGVTAAYTLNDHQSMNGSFRWAARGGLRTYTQFDSTSTPSGVLQSSSTRLSSGHDPESDYDQRLGFSQTLGRAGETLEVTAHRSSSQQREHYDYTNDHLVPPGETSYNNLTMLEQHKINEIGADYALPVSKTRFLKLGYDFERNDYRLRTVGNNVDPVTGAQVTDPNLTDDFKFRQQINAAYGSYQASSGSWAWLGGLRAEFARTDAHPITGNTSNSHGYFGTYPSLHVDRTLSDRSSLSFGASRRVTRPSPENLNPYIDYEYRPNLRSGNPNLRPQYTQSFEIGYDWQGAGESLTLTGYYRLDQGSVTELTEYLGNGLSLTTKVNLPKNDAAGVEFSSNGHIAPKLAYSVSGNLFHNRIDATALGASELQSTTGLNAKFKLDYRPAVTESAQISATRTDKRLTPQGYVSAINVVNLGYKHQVSSSLTGLVTVSDVFNGQRFQRYAAAQTFTENYQRVVQGRVVYLGFVFTFGAPKKDKQVNFEYEPSG